MQHYQQFINGEYVDCGSGKTRDIINPATEEVIATVPDSHPDDVNAAVSHCTSFAQCLHGFLFAEIIIIIFTVCGN